MSVVGIKKNHTKKGLQEIYFKHDPIYDLLELEIFSLSSFMIQRRLNLVFVQYRALRSNFMRIFAEHTLLGNMMSMHVKLYFLPASQIRQNLLGM